MIRKMKIIILVALIALSVSLKVQKTIDDTKTIAKKDVIGNMLTSSVDSPQEASRTCAKTGYVYLYNYSYTPVFSYDPVYYSSGYRSYYYYPYSSSYTYYPRSYFYYYRKSGEEAQRSQDVSKTENKGEAERKEVSKTEKIEVKLEDLEANMKKLKKELWGDENKSTEEFRAAKKAFDPAWLITQLNIATVLQIEDLLKEAKSNTVISVNK